MSGMASEDPMIQYLVELEVPYTEANEGPYDAVELVRYALGISDYWASLAVAWLEQGLPAATLVNDLRDIEATKSWPQSLRHRARFVRKQVE